MRYILDNNGYIYDASIGSEISCKFGACIEYVGTIPEGYESIDEWFLEECDRLNAWKVVDGELLFDSVRYSRLEEQYETQQYENSPVTNKELDKYMAGTNKQTASLFKTIESTQERISKLNNSKAFPIERVTINPISSITGYVDLILSNKNLLKNNALNQIISGITFEVNNDRSIRIDGTATADIEYNICGSSTNTSAFFVFKKDINYYLSSNNYQIKMYNFDGTNREQVYDGTGGSIKFTDEDKLVTQIVISIASNTTFDSVTIYPQLELGTTATEYISSEYNTYSINLDDNTFYKGGLYASESTIIGESTKITDGSADTIIIEDDEAILHKGEDGYPLGEITPYSFENITYAFTIQDTTLKAIHRTNILYGAFQGNIYDNDEAEILSGKGLASTFQYKSGDTYDWLGFNWMPDGTVPQYADKLDLKLFINLPTNFVVTKAILTLKHNPANYAVSSMSDDPFWGYSRKIEVYKSDNAGMFQVTGYHMFSIDTSDYEKIDSAFGTDGFTAPVPTDDTYVSTTIEADITNSIKNAEGEIILSLRPNYDIKLLNDSGTSTGISYSDLAKQTGTGLAYVTITGYVKYESKEE